MIKDMQLLNEKENDYFVHIFFISQMYILPKCIYLCIDTKYKNLYHKKGKVLTYQSAK